jgi:hypothetical protein
MKFGMQDHSSRELAAKNGIQLCLHIIWHGAQVLPCPLFKRLGAGDEESARTIVEVLGLSYGFPNAIQAFLPELVVH